MYTYSAFVTGVYDGDSITVDIDLGFNMKMMGQKIRLMDVNTPEMKGDTLVKAREVRDHVRKHILNQHITITTHKDRKGKYGRWLGYVYTLDGWSLNTNLTAMGYGQKY